MAQGENNSEGSTGKPKMATEATSSHNVAQNGIELKFNGEISGEMKAKLRAVGFRQSKLSNMWYATKSDETSSFARQVTEVLPDTTSGPPLNLSPSFDPVKPNLERREFSYITISLKDGQDKSFILFEPSKPRAEVIAFDFARKEFGNQFLELVVKPRQNIREARLLFEEGKIILPKKLDESPTIDGQSQPSIKRKISVIEPYHTIYKKLLQVIPNLIDHLEDGATSGKSTLNSKGMMDLHFDFLHKEKNGSYIIALAHYYNSNGDRISDPDMEIRVIPDMEAAEALTYQDTYRYQEVYPDINGKTHVNTNLKKSLNSFLKQWLNNLIQQGHKIDLTLTKEDDTALRGSDKNELSNDKENNSVTDNTVDYKSDSTDSNSILDPKTNDPLESAYWREGDEHPGVIVNGVAYHLARLREVLLDRLSKLPLRTQLEIVEELRKRFEERRPLDDYLKSKLTSGKSEENKKITAIKLYVDDIIIDNDLLIDSGYSVLSHLIKTLGSEPNIDALDIEPWTMSKNEFREYVIGYVDEFNVYPVEIMEMYDVLVRLFPQVKKLLDEKRPSKETLEKVVQLVHQLYIYKAIGRGLSLSSSVIEADYKRLQAKEILKFPQASHWFSYGFDEVNFKTSDSFLTLLQSIGVSSNYKKCSYLNKPPGRPPVYLWLGKDIRLVTAGNPLLTRGHASSIGIEGAKEEVLKAVSYIQSNSGIKPEEGLPYLSFDNLVCIDPEDPLFGQPQNIPTGDNDEAKKPQVENAKNSQNEVDSTLHEATYQKPKHKFSDVQEVDRSLIATKPEIFQGRETDFAQETVDKIVREGFDKSQEPIVVWKDEDGKLVVISGHSRWEASRRLYEAGDKSLQIMPVKIYQGTLAEAMDFALLESNRGVTQEGLKSDLRAYKYATQKGYNREYFKGIFKPESRLKLLEDISHLNEAGSFLTYIDTESEKSFPYLQRNAHWVGQIRKQFPILTNNHEEEMFKYLYGLNDPSKKSAGKKLIITKGHFFELIEKKISRIDFEAEKPLKLDQIVSANALTDPAKERIREIDKEIDKLEQERHQKDELIARATKEGRSALVEKFRNRQSGINQIITRKILEKEKIEGEIGILERTAIDLFTASETSVVVPENPTESHTLIKEADINRNFQPAQEHKQDAITEAHIPAQTDHDVQDRNKNTKTPEDYIDRIVAIMHDKYDRLERATRKTIEKIGVELGISDSGKVWEAVELSWLLWYQMLYKQSITFDARLSQMVRFWDKVQPTYEYSDSSKEIYKQYSTPCPISAIVAQYTGMDKTRTVFDPSAGNGLLVLGADAANTYVNEIDSTRIESLKFQSFKSITTFNATQPFPEEYTKAFDIVVTNPPFTKWEDVQFDKEILIQKIFDNHIGLNHHLRLEHVMCGIALHCMKDTGRAALIIMNHIYFDDNGYIPKYRPFFNWLYRHYFVDDVINLNSYKLYNKQGAIQKTMLILINGRKSTPFGVGPRKEDAPHFDQMVNSFEELWKRVNKNQPARLEIFTGKEVLNSMSDKSKLYHSMQLEAAYDQLKTKKFYKLPLSISELRRNDSYLDTAINTHLYNIKLRNEKEVNPDPIIIGEKDRPQPHSAVIDGDYRIAQALANGETHVNAYVPVDNKTYITKHHNGYSIEKVIQQLILATTI